MREGRIFSIKKIVWLFSLCLIFIEQGIKLLINRFYLNTDIPILSPWLYFKPVFNRSYSWINSMFQLGVEKWIHVGLVAVMMIFIFLIYLFLNWESPSTLLVDTAFIFLFAGSFCSLVDKIFWDGSLDYIYLKGFFTFDLKDVFVDVFIGLILLMLIIDHEGLKKLNRKFSPAFLQFLKRK